MKNNNFTSYILILGGIILVVFTYIAVVNLNSDDESSNPFYSKTQENINGRIENYEIKNNKLIVSTSGDIVGVCVKTTKSTPSINSICWNKVVNNEVSIPIYTTKLYYIWLKDNRDTVSDKIVLESN